MLIMSLVTQINAKQSPTTSSVFSNFQTLKAGKYSSYDDILNFFLFISSILLGYFFKWLQLERKFFLKKKNKVKP